MIGLNGRNVFHIPYLINVNFICDLSFLYYPRNLMLRWKKLVPGPYHDSWVVPNDASKSEDFCRP